MHTNTSIRRDIVDYSAVNASNPYWLCLHDGATGAGENPPTSGDSSNTYWETFGATFSSVATDVLLAQDATITRGLVIGTDGTTDGFIRSTNATASSGTGFYFHEDGTSWLGNKGASYLGISTAGVVTAAGFTITTDYLTSATGKSTYNSTTDGVFLGIAGIGLGTGQFHVSAAGYLTATSGLIGNWTIGSTLYATNILLDPSTPKITIGGKTGLASADTGIWLSTDGIALGSSSPFSVTAAGYLTATSALIGGWNVDNESMYTGNKKDAVGYTAAVDDITIHKDHGILAYQFYLGTDGNAKFKGAIEGGTIQIGSGQNVFSVNTAGMYLGNTTFADAEFSVTPGGDMHAESGDIAGWDFDDTKIIKQHASETRRIELDTSATIKDTSNHTGRQAISMTSGSNYNPLVQMSNVETFIDETNAYTSTQDLIVIEYDETVYTTNFATHTSDNYQVGGTSLVGPDAAGGGGEL